MLCLPASSTRGYSYLAFSFFFPLQYTFHFPIAVMYLDEVWSLLSAVRVHWFISGYFVRCNSYFVWSGYFRPTLSPERVKRLERETWSLNLILCPPLGLQIVALNKAQGLLYFHYLHEANFTDKPDAYYNIKLLLNYTAYVSYEMWIGMNSKK